MEQTCGNCNISSLTLSRRYRAFPDSFVYFSYSRYVVYENRAGHERRHVGLLPDSRNLVYYCDFSTCRIFSYAHKNAQSWLLQGPDPIYGCGKFYPCRWFYWNKGKFSADAVSSSWRCAFWIWTLEYYLKHLVMHWLVVGYTLPCVDSYWLQGACSQCQDPLTSQNLASGTTYINLSKINFEVCLGKALCSPVGDSHQCVWCCFLSILGEGERKFINSETTWITKCSGTTFLTSHHVYCSPLQTLGFLSACHPALLWTLVKLFLCFQFILGSGMRFQG